VLVDIKDCIVKITHTDICGSNVSSLAIPNGYAKNGCVLGHSFVGEITEIGEGVSNFQIGDVVVGTFELSCGQCRECKKEHYSYCLSTNNSALNFKVNGGRTSAEIGSSKMNGDKWGSFAEHIRIPYAANNSNKIPEGVDITNASLFSCNMTTAFHAVKLAKPTSEDIVYIGGVGSIGSLIAQYLIELHGVKKIVVADAVQDRLDLLKNKYPEQVTTLNIVEIGAPNMLDALMAESPLGYTLGVDATAFRYPDATSTSVSIAMRNQTDQEDVLNKCILVAAPFSRIVIVSEQRGNMNNVLTGPAFAKGLSIIFTGQTPVQKYQASFMKLVAENPNLFPDWLITHRINISQVPEFMRKHFNKTDGVQKVMVDL